MGKDKLIINIHPSVGYLLRPDPKGHNLNQFQIASFRDINIKSLKNHDIVLMPLSSHYKGPLFTVPTKKAYKAFKKDIPIVKIGVNYQDRDCPDFKTVHSQFDMRDNPKQRFLINPFIHHLNMLTDYNEQVRGSERSINIAEIAITGRENTRLLDTVTVNSDDADLLKEYGFATKCGKFFESVGSNIIFGNGNERDSRVFIYIDGSESCFGLKTSTYDMWCELASITIRVYRNDTVRDPDQCAYEIHCENLQDALKTCIVFPDLFYFDTTFYNEQISYDLEVAKKNGEHASMPCSYLDKNQERVSLFRMIDKILRMF